MPEDVVHPDDPRIIDVIDVLHDVWPERLSRRDEAEVRGTLVAGLPGRGDPDLSLPEGRRTMMATGSTRRQLRATSHGRSHTTAGP